MSSNQTYKPPGSIASTLVPFAWLLLAVAAPAAFVWFGETQREQPLLRGSESASAKRLNDELILLRAKEAEWLETYGWFDREAGIARVPIAEGINRILREPLPYREEQSR